MGKEKGTFSLDSKTKLVCPYCREVKTANYYYVDPIPDRSKYIPICKTCIGEHLKKYIAKCKSEAGGLWCLLAELGIPFYREIWDEVRRYIASKTDAGRKPNVFYTYLNYFEDSKLKKTGFWDSDVMLTDFYDPHGIAKQIRKIQREEKEEIDIKGEVEKWGKFTENGRIDFDAYKFLNKTFEDYTKDLADMDTNLINRYRDLCKAEWRLRKANESGMQAEISKAQDLLNKQLALLKLNDFTKSEESEEKRAFMRTVALIENYHPAECADLNKYIDMVGYEKEMAIPMRSIRNAIEGTKEYPDIPPEAQ